MYVILILVLFMMGMLLIFLEAILPFGISAVVGVLLLVVSGWVAIQEAGPATGTLYMLVSLVAAFAVLRLSMWAAYDKMALKPRRSANQPTGKEAAPEPKPGDRAQVVQPLRPTGTIQWENRRLSARSIYPEREIPIGAWVRVHSRDSSFLVVEPE